MINGLVDAFKNINNTIYHDNLANDSLSNTRNFIFTLAETDHRLNKLCTGFLKLESDVSTIYKYIVALSNKIVTTTLINPPLI